MSMLLSLNLASCRSKSCSCLDSNAHDTSIPFSFSKPPPLESQTAAISLDKISPIVSQAPTAVAEIALSEADALRSSISGTANPPFSDPQATVQEVELEGRNNATPKFVLGCENNTGTLEDDHLRISLDIDTTRHTLAHVEEAHTKERVCSVDAHSALGAQLLETLQAQLGIQRHAKNETSPRNGLLGSLRTVRAQHAEVSRALRKESTTNASLTEHLQAERTARKLAEDAFADLLLKNFALAEHNKLLISRDTTLQNDIAFLISKSVADNWMRLVLEDKLRSASSAGTFGKDVTNIVLRSPHSSTETSLTQELRVDSQLSDSISSIVESRPTGLRAQLVAVQDELHIAKCQLSVAEQRCNTLSAKVASLQEHISACVDECGAALEVERELRYEVEARVHRLLCETMALKDQAKLVGDRTDWQSVSVAACRETGSYVHPMRDIAVASLERCDTLEKENLKQKDLIHELSEKLATHERLQTEAKKLKGDIDRYEKMVILLQMKEKERTVDMRLKINAVQRLAQRKTRRMANKDNQWTPSSRGLARFMKQVVSSMTVHTPNKVNPNSRRTDESRQIRNRHASVPMIKTLIEALPVIVARHARRLSKALAEYSMAELNTLVNPSPSLSASSPAQCALMFDVDG